MIAYVKHRGLESTGVLFEKFDDLGQEIVGMQDRTVVSVADFFIAAVLELVCSANRNKAFEAGWVAFVVCGPVILNRVQYDENVAFRVSGDRCLKVAQHAFIPAFDIAQKIGAGLLVTPISHSLCHAFGVRLVVQPKHVHSGVRKYVQEVLC